MKKFSLFLLSIFLVFSIPLSFNLKENNTSDGEDFNKTLQTIPPVFQIGIVSATATTASFDVTLQSNTYITSQLQYSVENQNIWTSTQDVFNPENPTTSISLIDLIPETVYDVRIISTYLNSDNNQTTNTQFFAELFFTDSEMIFLDPVVSGVDHSGLTDTSVIISYHYEINSGNGNVEYRINGGDWTLERTGLVTGDYFFLIDILLPGTFYLIEVKPVDSTISDSTDFTTEPEILPNPDDAIVSGVSHKDVTQTSVIIEYYYEINDGSGEIEYRINSTQWEDDTTRTIDGNYEIELNDLNPGDRYIIEVRAKDSQIGGSTSFDTQPPFIGIKEVNFSKQDNIGLIVDVEVENISGLGTLKIFENETSTRPLIEPITNQQVSLNEYQFRVIGIDLTREHSLTISQGENSSPRHKTPKFDNNNIVWIDNVTINSITDSGKKVVTSFETNLTANSSQEEYEVGLYDHNQVLRATKTGEVRETSKINSKHEVTFDSFAGVATDQWFTVSQVRFNLSTETLITSKIISKQFQAPAPIPPQDPSSSSSMWIYITISIVGVLLVGGLVFWLVKRRQNSSRV